MQRRTFLAALPPVFIALPQLAYAQGYPNKPIRYIVPVAAGGGSDMVARTVTERWGKAARPDLRRREPGRRRRRDRLADHGARRARRLHADAGLRRPRTAPSPAMRKLPYDAVKDFTPIAMIGGTPNVLVVNAVVPAKTLKEFVAYVKANPGKLSYGSAGPGLAHAPGDGAVQAADRRLRCVHVAVPRHRARRSPTSWAARRRRCSRASPRRCRTSARAEMRPLAVTGAAAPSAAAGRADVRGAGLQGLRRRAVVRHRRPGRACPPTIVQAAQRRRSTRCSPRRTCASKLAGEALEPMPMTPEQFGQYIRADIARWTAARARNATSSSTAERTSTDHGPQHPGRRRPQRAARSRASSPSSSPTHPSRGWSDAVEHEAHRTFLNWLGCAVGAARHEAVEAALAAVQMLQPAPQATVLGRAREGRHGQRRAAQRHHARTPSTSTTRT